MHVRSRAFLRHAGGIVALLATAFAVQIVVDAVLVEWIIGETGVPDWLPAFGTIGETVTVYVIAGEMVSQVLVPLLMAYVGYRYGRLEREETV